MRFGKTMLSEEGSRANYLLRSAGLLSGRLGSIDRGGQETFQNCSLLSSLEWCRLSYPELSERTCGQNSRGFVSLAGWRLYWLAFRFSCIQVRGAAVT